MRLGTHLECIESSPRVSVACQDGAREFAGRRPRLTIRLSGVAERLPGVGKDFVEGNEKIARNTSGDRQRKTVRLAARNAGGYRITGRIGLRVVQFEIGKVKGITFSGFPMAEPLVSGGCIVAAQDFEWLSTAESPRLGG
ncbi:hypothetical protein BHE74_00020174 [Ensete ventricosum]|nr:hypothetical protein BHE74_00020174 [Ensete ventricosum]